MKYVGIDWAYRKAQWCALSSGGEIAGEGRIAADRDGLARLVLELGAEVKACLEMMSGALWVRDELVACGWQVEVADARKVKTVAPLAAKTDKVDARLLAELCRRELVPALWLPSLDERALRERLRRRMHLVRLRTSAKARIFGLQTQWGVRVSLARLRRADGLAVLERAGVPAVWRRSVSECLEVVDFLDARIAPLDAELRPLAKADPRAVLLDTIPGVAELLALTIAVEIGEISRFASPERLEFGVALGAGIAAGSVALTSFAGDSLVEVLAASVIVWLFSADRGASERAERRAQQLVAASYYLLVAYIVSHTLYDLAAGDKPAASWVGVGLAAVTAPTMPLLARAKRKVGHALNSSATVSEASQNQICAYLSIALLVGLLLNALAGWWWADPAAALVIAGFALREGRESWRGTACDCC